MKIHFTGRHVEVTKALKAHAEERLNRVTNHLDDVMDVHVILSVEKHRHMAEITLKTRTKNFVASSTTDDMYASLNQTADRLEAQALKHHDKKASKSHASVKAQALAGEE